MTETEKTPTDVTSHWIKPRAKTNTQVLKLNISAP